MNPVTLDAVRASNATLKTLGPGLVAVFVGGTSGIGEATLKAFVKAAASPRVYIVGRNQTAADRIARECKASNGTGSIEFLQADVSELKNVDRVCAEIVKREETLNLLVLTPGILTLQGRNESPEGLDRKMVMHYYSRMLFISALLPLLHRAAQSSPPQLSSALSVLGAGNEGKMIETDLDLKTNFSLKNAANHCITMTDFALEHFAAAEKGTSFVHTLPGFVKTNVAANMPLWARGLLWVANPLMTPFSVGLEETGERHLFMATSGRYPPASGDGARAPIDSGIDVARGSNGEIGSGVYMLNWNGKVQTGTDALMADYRKRGVAEKVWEHTAGVFERVRAADSAVAGPQ